MKRAAVLHAAPPKINYKDLAPADEYFGPLKLSILGIRNTTSDAGKRYQFGIRDADSTMSTAAFVDLSVREWARRYPRDQEVARAVYFLQRLYAMIATPAAQSKAKAEASWMFASYAKTPQAKMLRRILASAPAVPPAAPTPAADLSPAPLETGAVYTPTQTMTTPAASASAGLSAATPATSPPASHGTPIEPTAAQIDASPSPSPSASPTAPSR